MKCDGCHGTGKIIGGECPECDGEGLHPTRRIRGLDCRAARESVRQGISDVAFASGLMIDDVRAMEEGEADPLPLERHFFKRKRK